MKLKKKNDCDNKVLVVYIRIDHRICTRRHRLFNNNNYKMIINFLFLFSPFDCEPPLASATAALLSR